MGDAKRAPAPTVLATLSQKHRNESSNGFSSLPTTSLRDFYTATARWLFFLVLGLRTVWLYCDPQKAQYKKRGSGEEHPHFMRLSANPHNSAMNLTLASRFSRRFGLSTPIALAPMALASGGALAAACAHAGALGLVGGGYAELAWTQREYALAQEHAGETGRIGCGFIVWKLDEDASALDWVLEQRPRAIMLSFGDPRPYGQRIAQSGAELLCQVQRMEQVPMALEAGASVVIAQGAEAGGHGANSLNSRATISFVPELADWLSRSFARNPAARRRRYCGRAHPGGGAGAGRGRRVDGLTAVGDSRKPGRARGETAGSRSGRRRHGAQQHLRHPALQELATAL